MRKKQNLGIHEQKRLKALYSYNIVNNYSDKFLNNITQLTSKICETPISLITLIDDKIQWLKSKTGIKIKQTPRETSFCNHAIQQNELFIIPDTEDNPIFKDNPLVTGEFGFRFYAGMPLTTADGYNLGTLCILDYKPKILTDLQKATLISLSKTVIEYLTLRKNNKELSLMANGFKSLFLNSPDLLCTASPDGYLKKISSSFHKELGFTNHEIKKQPFINFVHPDDRQMTLNVLSSLGSKGTKIKFFRNRYQCKNGNYIWLSWNSISDNKTGEIIATARNIDEIIKMEKEVKLLRDLETKTNEEKILQLSILTAALSHEMLNPLNMILGFSGVSLELVEEILTSRDEAIMLENLNQIKSDLLKVKTHAGHMSNVVGSLASIQWNSNSYSSQIRIPGKSFRINRVLEESAKLAYSNFKVKNPDFRCRFVHHYAKNDPGCFLSVHDFSNSVMNIFYNAFEAIITKTASHPDFTPSVHVSTALLGNKINIRIANNGVVIPRDTMKLLFDPFYTTKPTGRGLGLGLCISYNIIKMHHGSIKVEKSNEKETSFKISLPAGKLKTA